jgi:predicted DNA repair protein MutK
MVSEEINNEAMISTWLHYGLTGLIFGVGGTLLGLWQLATAHSTVVSEMGTALVVLCPLMAVLALVSLTIARKMRAELGQNNIHNASHQ